MHIYMNKAAYHPAYSDNPWRRLPWILPSTFLIWGALLWCFGLALGQMAGRLEPPVAIDARIIELPAPVKPPIALKQPVRKVMPKSSPPQLSAPMQQPSVQSHGQTLSMPRPAVSLPEAKSQPGSLISPYPKPPVQGSGETVTPPRFGAAYLNNPKPEYPVFARRMRMEGVVMLKVLVSSRGAVLRVEVAHSSGYEILDKSAAGAVQNWRFVPAKHGDSPVDEWVQVPLAFHLKK